MATIDRLPEAARMLSYLETSGGSRELEVRSRTSPPTGNHAYTKGASATVGSHYADTQPLGRLVRLAELVVVAADQGLDAVWRNLTIGQVEQGSTPEIMSDDYHVIGNVELFPQEGGWYYIAVPQWISDELADLADRGLVAIRATVGTASWDTSLLPRGDGSHFVALNAKVRKANAVNVGDRITLTFQPSDRR